MTKDRVILFDTTLRDGAQTQGVDFSVEDKRTIASALDQLGIDYVEGGWPGANPTDTQFFADPPALARARFTAFGMTTAASYAWSGLVSWGLAALFVAGGIAGGLIGTRSAKSLSERRGALNIVFAIVIIAVAIYMLVRNLSLSFA